MDATSCNNNDTTQLSQRTSIGSMHNVSTSSNTLEEDNVCGPPNNVERELSNALEDPSIVELDDPHAVNTTQSTGLHNRTEEVGLILDIIRDDVQNELFTFQRIYSDIISPPNIWNLSTDSTTSSVPSPCSSGISIDTTLSFKNQSDQQRSETPSDQPIVSSETAAVLPIENVTTPSDPTIAAPLHQSEHIDIRRSNRNDLLSYKDQIRQNDHYHHHQQQQQPPQQISTRLDRNDHGQSRQSGLQEDHVALSFKDQMMQQPDNHTVISHSRTFPSSIREVRSPIVEELSLNREDAQNQESHVLDSTRVPSNENLNLNNEVINESTSIQNNTNQNTTTELDERSTVVFSAYLVDDDEQPPESMILLSAHASNVVVDDDDDMVSSTAHSLEHFQSNGASTTTSIRSTSNEPLKKRPYLKWLLGVTTILVIIVVLVVTLISSGIILNARSNNNASVQQVSKSLSPTVSPVIIPKGKQFVDRNELLNAVDDYLYGTNSDDLYDTYGPIEYWDVSAITNFSYLFATQRIMKASDFIADIGRWDVSSAVDVSHMFDTAEKFDADLSRWDVSKVQNFDFMFTYATNFTSDLSRWNVSSALSMKAMLAGLKYFTSDLSQWDVSSVRDMYSMLTEMATFTSDLSKWDVSSVTDLSFMFFLSTNFTSDLSRWDVSRCKSLHGFVLNATRFDSDLSKWDTSLVTSFDSTFLGAESFVGSGIDQWDVSNGVFFDFMFNGATLFDADLSLWDVSNASSMIMMFADTKTFKGTGLDQWDLSNVSDTNGMFKRAEAFDCDVSLWDLSNVVDMTGMFARTDSFRGVGLNSMQYNQTAFATSIFCDARALNKSYIPPWNFTKNETEECYDYWLA